MNAHDRVMGAFLGAFKAAPELAGGMIFPHKLRKLPEDAPEAIVVRFGASSPNRATVYSAPVDWETRIVVECHVRADDFDEQDGSASGALHGKVFERLMADPSLGGIAFDVLEPDLDYQNLEGDSELGCMVAQYIVRHRTSARSLVAA